MSRYKGKIADSVSDFLFALLIFHRDHHHYYQLRKKKEKVMKSFFTKAIKQINYPLCEIIGFILGLILHRFIFMCCAPIIELTFFSIMCLFMMMACVTTLCIKGLSNIEIVQISIWFLSIWLSLVVYVCDTYWFLVQDIDFCSSNPGWMYIFPSITNSMFGALLFTILMRMVQKKVSVGGEFVI